MFKELKEINTRPKPFEFYTASDLWTDKYLSEQMLSYHLNEEIDLSSRNTKFIDRSVEWIVGRFNVGADSKIADFGCGPGLYSTRLARNYANVVGIGFSKRSIEYAQDNCVKGSVLRNQFPPQPRIVLPFKNRPGMSFVRFYRILWLCGHPLCRFRNTFLAIISLCW